MQGLSIGDAMMVISGVGALFTGLWVQFGKSRDSNLTHLVQERDRQDRRIAELEKSREEERRAREEDRARIDKVENDLEKLKREFDTLLDFLRDIVSGRFDWEWVKGRAGDLLDRFGGPKK